VVLRVKRDIKVVRIGVQFARESDLNSNERIVSVVGFGDFAALVQMKDDGTMIDSF
jgi:hypothetical protein